MLDTLSMAAQLKGDYKFAFEKADMYRTLRNYNDESVDDDMMMNLYDLLLQAQTEGEAVSKIVGEDIEEFCKAYFESEEEKRLPKWYFALRMIYNMAWWGVIAGLFELLLPEEEGALGVVLEVDIMPLLVGLLFGLGSLLLVWGGRKFVFKSKKLKPFGLYVLILIVLMVAIVGAGVVSVIIEYKLMIKANLLLGASGFYVMAYLIIRSLWRYRDHGTLGKYSREEMIRHREEKNEKEVFNKEVSKQNIVQTVNSMKIRYRRLNRRYEKKHGNPMSLDEFRIRLNGELQSLDKSPLLFLGIVMLIYGVSIIHTFMTSAFVDSVIYCVLMLISFIFVGKIWKWMNRIARQSYDEMIYVLDLCIRFNLNLDTVGKAVETGEIQLKTSIVMES